MVEGFNQINEFNSNFYDGSTLLNKKCKGGKKPEIYISQTLRTYGKTTFYFCHMLRNFIKSGKPFGLLVRYKYEVSSGVSSMLSKIGEFYDFDPGLVKNYNLAAGNVKKVVFNGVPMFYVFALNGAKQVKVLSSELSSISEYCMDEIQPEDNKYLPDEIEKFISIHVSISRGVGEASRHVPVYLLTNDVSYLNPYYVTLGISSSVDWRTKYLRGDGFVFESIGSEYIVKEQIGSSFNSAFKNHQNMGYILGKKSLLAKDKNDIMKLAGNKNPIFTIVSNAVKYGLWKAGGFYYFSKKYDPNIKYIYGVSQEDCLEFGVQNRKVLDLNFYRNFFENGVMRFDSPEAKTAGLLFLRR